MQMAFAALGAVLLLVAIAGFFRSFWRAAPKRERDEQSPDGFPGGGLGIDSQGSGHDAGGGDGSAGH